MRVSQLPGIHRDINNGGQLRTEMAQAIGYVDKYRNRTGKEPASAAKLIAFLDAAKAKITAGVIPPVAP